MLLNCVWACRDDVGRIRLPDDGDKKISRSLALHIKAVWTGMRPLSLRKAMAGCDERVAPQMGDELSSGGVVSTPMDRIR